LHKLPLPQNGPIILFEHLFPASNCFFKYRRNVFLAAETDTAGRADTHTRRQIAFGQPVNAQIALCCNLPMIVELHGAKRTRFYAFAATDTPVIVD
jgi:hypothetical protein